MRFVICSDAPVILNSDYFGGTFWGAGDATGLPSIARSSACLAASQRQSLAPAVRLPPRTALDVPVGTAQCFYILTVGCMHPNRPSTRHIQTLLQLVQCYNMQMSDSVSRDCVICYHRRKVLAM